MLAQDKKSFPYFIFLGEFHGVISDGRIIKLNRISKSPDIRYQKKTFEREKGLFCYGDGAETHKVYQQGVGLVYLISRMLQKLLNVTMERKWPFQSFENNIGFWEGTTQVVSE